MLTKMMMDWRKVKNVMNQRPRALHKTLSIFLRNLPPAVTKQEVEEVGFYF
jgi:RNA recognition motif-containing protein